MNTATAIVEHRELAGGFQFSYQLLETTTLDQDRNKVFVIDENKYNDLLPWITLGLEDDAQSLYYQRINLNTAAPEHRKMGAAGFGSQVP